MKENNFKGLGLLDQGLSATGPFTGGERQNNVAHKIRRVLRVTFGGVTGAVGPYSLSADSGDDKERNSSLL